LIHDEKLRSRINPLTEDQAEIDFVYLASILKTISKIEGKFTWSDDGKKAFEDWYEDLGVSAAENPDSDPTGTKNRIHDQMLKVAMLLALGREQSLVLKLEDINDAIRSCTEFMTLTKSMTLGSGEHELSFKTGLFIQDLVNKVLFV